MSFVYETEGGGVWDHILMIIYGGTIYYTVSISTCFEVAIVFLFMDYLFCLSVCLCVVCMHLGCSNWEEWRLLRTKSNKQIVPRRVLEFTPLINAVTEDLMQHLRDNRGLDNSVEDVVAPLMEWSFEGAVLWKGITLFVVLTIP